MSTILDKIRAQFVSGEVWPPRAEAEAWKVIEEYRARFRNDKGELAQKDPNIATDAARMEVFTPVPWPRELCRFSAALLFSETPKVTYATEGEDGETSNTAALAALADLLEVNDFGAFAIRGGVRVAAEGRCGIRVILDSDIDPDIPLLTIVPEDQIIWDIRHDSFYAGGIVVVTRKPDPTRQEVYRLLETHTPGLVERKLYKGIKGELGHAVPLSTIPEFAHLAPEWNTGLDRPTLIPWENVPGAESDLFGLGPLFDEANEAESLLVDRARKSIPRLFVDKSLADETGRVNIDGVILTGGSRMRAPLGAPTGDLVNTIDVKIQFSEHTDWTDHVNQMIVAMAGYAPSTWGFQGKTGSVQRAVSGYAMKLAQLRTLLNRAAKEHMALQALGWAVATATALQTNVEHVADCLPGIELGDGLPNDPLDGAQEVLFLRQAMAASTEVLVKTVHPTWSPEEINAEVDAINDAMAMTPAAGLGTGIGPMPTRAKDIIARGGRAGDGVDDEVTPV
jgi:hypothetical protein